MDGSFVGVGLDQNTFMFEGFVPINAEKENIVDIDCKTKVHGFFFGVRFHVGYGKTNRILGL